MIDLMAIIVLMATLYFCLRRFLLRPQALRTTPLDSAIIYSFLMATTLSYLFFEACAATAYPEEMRLSFLGPLLSRFSLWIKFFNLKYWLALPVFLVASHRCCLCFYCLCPPFQVFPYVCRSYQSYL